MQEPQEDYFIIHPLTGDLTVTQVLSNNLVLQLTVTATVRAKEKNVIASYKYFLEGFPPQDGGSPPLNSSLIVSVRVTPAPPLFESVIYEASVEEFTDSVS